MEALPTLCECIGAFRVVTLSGALARCHVRTFNVDCLGLELLYVAHADNDDCVGPFVREVRVFLKR
jgi:hypothetical protein